MLILILIWIESLIAFLYHQYANREVQAISDHNQDFDRCFDAIRMSLFICVARFYSDPNYGPKVCRSQLKASCWKSVRTLAIINEKLRAQRFEPSYELRLNSTIKLFEFESLSTMPITMIISW